MATPLLRMLLKFGEKDHLNNLMEYGHLHIKNYDYFQQTENVQKNCARFDEYEFVDQILQPKDLLKITIDDHDFKVDHDSKKLIKFYDGSYPEFSHIYCLTSVTDDAIILNGEKKIYHPDCYKFGDHFILILDTQAFRDRVIKALQAMRIDRIKVDLVEYVPETEYSGPIGPFRKISSFAYQAEYRFAFQANCTTPIELKIGNLKDIAFGPIHKSESRNCIIDGNAIIS